MIPAAAKLRAPLAALGVASALAVAPTAAHADQYVVDHCRHFDPDSPWVAFPDVKGVTVDDCSGGSGGLNARAGGGLMATGARLEISLSIPADRPNIHIERVQTVYAADGPIDGSATSLSLLNHLDQPVRLNQPPATVNADVVLPPGARSLRWVLACGTASSCQFQDEYPLFVNKSRLYLNESVNPRLTVTGGTLAGAGAKAGAQSLTFDASDTDSGVASVSVALGSTVVGAVTYACPFNDWSVCQRDRASQALQVDTTKVPDGNHELLVTVRDAANNVLTRSLGTVTVANGPSAGAPNGGSASRPAQITARFATTRKRAMRVRYGSRPTVRGRLVNDQGQPITAAGVAVLQRLKRAGADPVQIATVTTGADGTFSYKLPGGPSRTMTFAYSAFTNDREPTATSSLRTVVRAQLSARISPRTVGAGKKVTLTGRLRLLGREGVQVQIQARDASQWRTIAVVSTTRDGDFRWRYRFKPSGAGRTFAFRARVASPIYPFASGSSRPVLVRVR
jgi:hypothetical protein